ncbi:MAG: thiol peroxidase [Alkalibacterium sp.]|uniref:Thiol peroxidase, atypical 2-Cys peroxiredoxin n=1 Tax=Alkalibacterium gilvum TaxID=1130080 RepID=A0A1H6UL70_9LACT|nr:MULTISPECIES: thiol peroxidase [Alkalibacterium]MDN6194111.1 thiol peroxidase [Alkalibacterium sp.]MDN6293226.1 thiol peroxidase [Alkalibacterium sp.]MDN6295272.1 thiol peroxidase [Alkalibacterium sp.]MDN6385596.1 thiol peroxidase [Alkalibacterium sp.]MDN6397912.1 thiol peroxidase [Alkalibacterium sp.]
MHVTLKGEKFQTNGSTPNVGETAPSFILKNLDDSNVELSDYKGEVVILSTFPDIETSTCARQTDTFNKKGKELSNTTVLSISANTVKEQEEWAKTKDVDTILLHDSERSFAKAYGLYIEGIDKIARSVFVLNKNGQIVYKEIVKEMADDPNYEKALSAAKKEEAELS